MRTVTDSEVEKLRELWKTKTIKECAKELSRCTSTIYHIVKEHGLKRPDSYRNNGQFKKGQPPWNKGKPHPPSGRSKTTQFKRGHGNSNNSYPIGHEKRDKDGVLLRKVSNTGKRSAKWRPVKDLVYEQYNGKIPKDHIVNFANGNKNDLTPSNLIALTRAEMMSRNSIQRYGPEYHSVAIRLGYFKSKVKELEYEKR